MGCLQRAHCGSATIALSFSGLTILAIIVRVFDASVGRYSPNIVGDAPTVALVRIAQSRELVAWRE